MASLKPKGIEGKVLLDKLTQNIFLKNITDARRAQGKNVLEFEFDKTRCRILSACELANMNKSGILYWMSRDCRVQDNWAMLYAQRLALKTEQPLYVCFLCKDLHCLYPTKRQFGFLAEGLKILRKECKQLKIPFYFLNASPVELASIVRDNDVSAVVCDFNPLKKPTEWKESLIKSLPADVPFIEVDAHNIVPAWIVSNKQEIMARTLRPKIHEKLPIYLTGYPLVCRHEYSGKLKTDLELSSIDDATYEPLWEVDEITWAKAGPEAGLETLLIFIKDRLKYYGTDSNDPSKNNISNISPWLHFGQVSSQRCALEIKTWENEFKPQIDKFLEELIVRKELSDNFCLYNRDHGTLNAAPDWAKLTLEIHKKDKRTWLYSKNQLMEAKTHDEMWNAAQLQLMQHGKIHGYMRMYWAKKILEWTESAEQALEYTLWFNDVFSIDGTDPNGVAGVLWSICGVHDQGFQERQVFGKIRFMVDYSLARKFNMGAYCAEFGRTLTAAKSRKRKTPEDF